jgi:hypothetical protein
MAMAMERRAKRRPKWLPQLTFVKRSRFQAIGIIGTGLVASALCVQVGVAAFAREAQSPLALAVTPWDARAMSAWAGQLQVLRGQANDPEAVRLARAALVRDATLPTPYRVLGFAREANGDVAGAERLIGFSDKLSRRDLPAQLWLIERAVARNDVPGAVAHFDTALRTSEAAPELLFPVLANALSEREVVDAVAPRLLTAPWAQEFIAKSIDSGPSVPGLVMLAQAMDRLNRPFTPDTMRQLINRVVETKSYELLPRLRAISPARMAKAQGVADPGFDKPVGVPSFDWTFDESDRAEITRGAGSGKTGFAFELGEAGVAAQLARQLLTLAPGRYTLAVEGSSNIGDQGLAPTWSVRCAEGAQQLGQVDMATGNAATVRRASIVVPAQKCVAQFLIFSTRPVAGGSVSGRVSRVTITPA